MYIVTIRREKLDSSVPQIDLRAHVTNFLEGHRI
jgi:hypothetical protein